MNIKNENEATSKLAAERQVKKFGVFIEEYADDLRELKNRLNGRGEHQLFLIVERSNLLLLNLLTLTTRRSVKYL